MQAALYPLEGYTFEGVAPNAFTHGGAETVTHGTGAAGSPLEVTIVFE